MSKLTRVVVGLVFALFPGSVEAATPNIVMIVGDDQGWGDYSFMGHAHIRTPHIDKLAAEGLTFRHGYVPSSLCRPSLASMITGLYPHQHRITSNDPPLPSGKAGRLAEQDAMFLAQRQEMIAHFEKVPTLPKLLGQPGYVSFQSGKWWEGNACRCGFTEGMTHGDPKRGGRHGDVGLKIGREGLKEVFDFIDSAAKENQPFYIWYAPLMPHTPHNPPERLLAKYRDKTDSPFVAKYWAMCEWFDETVGELVSHVDNLGLSDNTLVVYLHDNGWIQDPSADRYAPKSKRSPYDGGLRTPIILRWKGHIAPRSSDTLVLSIDLPPTLLSAVGQKPTAEMQGLNLLDDHALKNRSTIFGEIYEHNAVDIHVPVSSLQYRWLVSDHWKLIVPAPQRIPNGRVELYNLARDPQEETNLSEQHPSEVTRLTLLLNRWWPGR